jgi:hypothetical protein
VTLELTSPLTKCLFVGSHSQMRSATSKVP